jgi:pimeloyl-ACP methyl ester carboxylesterase
MWDLIDACALRPSRVAAVEHFENLRNFEKWDREALAAYMRGAIIDEADGTASLACHPHIEASLYCHEVLHFEDEQLPRAKCKVAVHYGSRTKMFYPPDFDVMQKRWPEIYTLNPAMPNTSHAMVLENPELSAQRIKRDLAQLDTYKPSANL